MIFFHKSQDVRNINIKLANQFYLKFQIIRSVSSVSACMTTTATCSSAFQIITEAEVPRLVVLPVTFTDDADCIALFQGFRIKLIKTYQYISLLDKLPIQLDEAYLLSQRDGRIQLAERIFLQKILCQFLISCLMFPILLVAIVIFLKCSHQNNTVGISIAEKTETPVGGFYEIAETNDVTTILIGIQNTVGSAESLQQSMHSQVLIYPERIETFCVKARQEHSYHNEQIYILVLGAQGKVLVVVLEHFSTRIV